MFAVEANQLTKAYRLYKRPSDRLKEMILRRPFHQTFESLKDVSFTVPFGQSLGIVGPNGAGKSTLLKILAGTLTPTSGQAVLSGRAAALLELGAGFQPDFTGLQNIHLNAALLGLSASEIEEKLPSIVEFAGLGDFIGQPLKTYSSGMVVRLAFSVAASVDPDILIIDEALAVGDASFQRKCMDRMQQFKERGKTMVFCSHSMYHVQELCEKALWLEKGTMRLMGPSPDVTARYEDSTRQGPAAAEPDLPQSPAPRPERSYRIRGLKIQNTTGQAIRAIRPLDDVVLKMEVDVLRSVLSPRFGFAFMTSDNTVSLCGITHHDKVACGPFQAGDRVSVGLTIHGFPLRQGTFRVIAGVSEDGGLLWQEYQELWPVEVMPQKGLGLTTAKKEWRITKNESQK